MTHVLAIIGASTGQRQVYLKAREMGFRTLGFSWEEGAVCRDLADRFFPISITDTDRIVEVCKEECVSGVVSNGSDLTAEAVSRISSALGLPGIPVEAFLPLKDKSVVRELTRDLEGLSTPWSYFYEGQDPPSFPCVVKPCVGSAKRGVSYVEEASAFLDAIRFSQAHSSEGIIVEAYIPGQEISVETLSARGVHQIVQMTDKDSSGPPHFVETGHHQPSTLPQECKDRIAALVPRLLTRLHYDNGAAHIEFKVTEDGSLFLIEVNPRGGGDEIADQLVPLSTGFDYIGALILVALGQYTPRTVNTVACSGIYYLCNQTRQLLPFFSTAEGKPWLVSKVVTEEALCEATTNYDRNGYLIYSADHKILPTD